MNFITRHSTRQPPQNKSNLRTVTCKLEVRTLIAKAILGKNIAQNSSRGYQSNSASSARKNLSSPIARYTAPSRWGSIQAFQTVGEDFRCDQCEIEDKSIHLILLWLINLIPLTYPPRLVNGLQGFNKAL